MLKIEKKLYFECASGISGDMVVGALLDLGASREKMERALESLKVEGLHYHISQKKSYGLAGCDFDVHFHGATDHDATEEHAHHHHHHHEHRNLADVNAIIDRGEMTFSAGTLAKKIFQIVAEAESKAHGCPIENVHFHEVGAIDSIADIVAAAVLLDDLGISECIVPALSEGSGYVECQHGKLPVPVPAVLNIAQAYGIALCKTEVQGEMVTPTGIAIAAAIQTCDQLPKTYKIEKIGIGLGKRDFGRPNCLRVMLVSDEVCANEVDEIYVVEANIDDSTGEELGLAMEKLFDAGARDVALIPCFMKKNRPGCILQVLADVEKLPEIETIIFELTTTVGLRKYPVKRSCMERKIISVCLACGNVLVKCCTAGTLVKYYPEYESVKALAEKTGVPFVEIFAEAKRIAGADFHSM